jgi:uncharacterized protein
LSIEPDKGLIGGIVLKVASLCNLNCNYCYLYQHGDKSYLSRPEFITDEVFDQLLDRMAEYCDRRPAHVLSITFHGGEPTLIGADWIDRAAARAQERLGSRLSKLVLQTNGVLLDDKWLNVVSRRDLLISISLDGPQHIHDRTRVNHGGRGSYLATARALRRVMDRGITPNILCVVNPEMSGVQTYRHFRSLGIRSMNFLLPDITHDNRARVYDHPSSTPVADYLIPIFDEWFGEDDPDIRVSIFHELITLVRGGKARSDSFGNLRSGYVVVETDGGIHANDVLRISGHDIGNGGLNIFTHGFDDLHLGSPLLYRMVHEGIGLCETCQACPEKRTCGGGHIPHRYAHQNGFDNPSAWCSDIMKMLAHIRKEVQACVA